VPTKSWRGKSAVFRIYSALTSHGYSKSIKAVRRQKNLGLIISIREKIVLITLKGGRSLKENYLCVNVAYTKISFFVMDKYIDTHG
jgi:hypothetical protein